MIKKIITILLINFAIFGLEDGYSLQDLFNTEKSEKENLIARASKLSNLIEEVYKESEIYNNKNKTWLEYLKKQYQIIADKIKRKEANWSDETLIFPSDVSKIILNHIPDYNFAVKMQFKGHKDCVSQVVWSYDGKLLARTFGKIIKIVEIDTGKIIRVLEGHENNIISITWSPDDKIIASLDDSGVLIKWDLKNEKYEKTNKIKDMDCYGKFNPVMVRFAPATTCYSFEYALAVVYPIVIEFEGIKEYDHFNIPPTKKNKETDLDFNNNNKISIAWSPDGYYLVKNGKCLKVYDNQLKEIRAYGLDRPDLGHCIGHKDYINCVCWSYDGNELASCSDDKTIKIWPKPWQHSYNKDYLNPDKTLEGHKDKVNSISFSADNKFIVSGSDDRTIIIWNVNSGEIENILYNDQEVKHVSWSPDNLKLVSVSTDGTVKIWEKVEIG